MQEQNEQKEAERPRKAPNKDLIFGSVGVILMLTLAIIGLCAHSHISMSYRGQKTTPFPWVAEGAEVSAVQAKWQSAEKSGNEYMKYKVGVYPEVTIDLADTCDGSGHLWVEVVPGNDFSQTGESAPLPKNSGFSSIMLNYEDGRFNTKDSPTLKASGKRATINFTYGLGYAAGDTKDFSIYAAMRNHTLWRVYVYHQPKNYIRKSSTDKGELMGFTTIPVTGEEL